MNRKPHPLSTIIWVLALAALGCGCNRSPAPDEPQPLLTASTELARPVQRARVRNVPPASQLPIYGLKVSDAHWSQLQGTSYSDRTYPATFLAGGEIYENARVRYRGAWARGWPKKPLKIFFDKEKEFRGLRCLNLNSGWRDPAFIREPVAYHIYAACGVPAPKARLVRLELNGEFHGVYVEVEQPDKSFLTRNNLKGAAVYKASSRRNQSDERDLGGAESFAQHYEKQTGEKNNFNDLQEFCHELQASTNAWEFFNQRVVHQLSRRVRPHAELGWLQQEPFPRP